MVGVDGKTVYESLKVKRYRGEILEFGCRVHHSVPGKTQGGLLAARWHTGVWFGKRCAIDEHLVSMPDGTVVCARAVQASPVEHLWSKEAVVRVKGMPWTLTSTLTQTTYQLQQKVQVMKDIGYRTTAWWRSRASLGMAWDPYNAQWWKHKVGFHNRGVECDTPMARWAGGGKDWIKLEEDVIRSLLLSMKQSVKKITDPNGTKPTEKPKELPPLEL